MEDSKITRIRGRGVPIRGADIDTDRIIPARYLRTVTFADLGQHAFEDDRRSGAHPFDDPRFGEARILIANANFGCGSSREHAPQALMRWGIQAFVAESFAEIFFGNCVALGLPCVVVPASEAEWIQDAVEQDPAREILLDLETLELSLEGRQISVTMPEGARRQFIEGTWDSLGQLLQAREQILETAEALPYMKGFGEN